MKKVFLIGDSLMQDYNGSLYPQYGYGTLIKPFIKDDILVFNLARAGASTKSFINEKRFDFVKNNIEKDDLLIIEFGNNDEKIEDVNRGTKRDSEFLDNISYFIETAKNVCANFILLTSPTRHNFINNMIEDNHKGYPKALVDFALKNNYYIIDLNEITKEYYNALGESETESFHLIFDAGYYKRFNDGVKDHSHYTYKGALFIASIIIKELEKSYKLFNEYFNSYNEVIEYNEALKLI